MLAFGDLVEEIEELREAYGGRVGTLDEGFSRGAESSHAEGHGDAVIVGGVDGGAVKGLAARYVEAIFELGEFGSHGAEVFRDEGDAVGLFDAEFFGVAVP